MVEGLVSVVVDDAIRWTRRSGPAPEGMASADRSVLLSVLSLLVEATEQVTVQLRALEHSDGIPDVGTTTAQVDDDVPVAGVGRRNSGREVFEVPAVIPV